MRSWRLVLGAVLLVWVLGAAYYRARRRGRELGVAVLFAGTGIFLFAAAALTPRPPMTPLISNCLAVASVILLGTAMGIVLWRGFRE
ncbi:MAG: hypothetical protein JSV79_13585 [Armatimonadota bacterium]|nr:MAG: hypothetical protein JSV79_13585 [Armatimonadota bacterium]